MAAQVARALPPERYEPFILALLASQDRWAFARGVNSTDELCQDGGAGRHVAPGVRRGGGRRRAAATRSWPSSSGRETTYKVDSTPTFIFNGPNAHDRRESGELSYDSFARCVAEASGATG